MEEANMMMMHTKVRVPRHKRRVVARAQPHPCHPGARKPARRVFGAKALPPSRAACDADCGVWRCLG